MIETCLAVVNEERDILAKKLSYEDIIEIRQNSPFKKQNKVLYHKFGEKFKEVRAWLASFTLIEETGKRHRNLKKKPSAND